MNDREQSAADSLPLAVDREINRLCREFEQALRADLSPRIEDFLRELAPETRAAALRELLGVELELRQSAGQPIDADDYRRRFPEYPAHVDAELQRALPESSPDISLQSTKSMAPANTDHVVAPPQGKTAPDDEPVPALIGRYQILRILGEGGFGRVYLAEDTELRRQVALKVPKKKFFESGNSVEAFLEEARTAARLKHAGLVPVHDVQQEAGRPFIVQEYIDGSNLNRWMREAGATHEQIVTLLIEIAVAVGFLHQQRLVHRDLKPGNILIDGQGHAHVADFGLAVHESTQWARAGEVAGTWQYMSPEQLRGETHLLDGRSDLWSLGVILYELLVGRRPFPATDPQELRDQIRTLEPRPPRQLVPDVPPELERICLKCLQQRRTDRYSSAADLVDDLRHWREAMRTPSQATEVKTVAVPDQATTAPRIVPKGLRSFDEHDADFFLELLPGARDRDGLPESIRFWKTRIEEPDPDQTFSVGLLYGPSGCGKSSLVKAGLLPRLASHVVAVYVEATADDTEVRLLKGLKKKLPHLPESTSLPEILQRLRQRGLGGGRKLLIVLDQFEQWLHAHGGEDGSQLVDALRHCDGGNVQSVVLVRDDFWMPATRFMRALEARLVEGHNSNPVDLFPVRHAEEVLTKFGRAFRTLPENSDEQSPEQSAFVQQSVSGLAHEGKVICVRLALFAEMMKGKPWTPATLKEVGGTQGIGVTFLEETFSASTAPPEHRLHQNAARAILKTLLPETGTAIKGNMRSYDELLLASGYGGRPRDFADLMQILDGELRLITPTDPEGKEEGGSMKDDSERPADSSLNLPPSSFNLHPSRYYQLTHDYLVPSLSDWLTRKQKETRRGRAELRLAERAALWNSKPENRHLPAWWEFLNIVSLVPSKNWSGSQQQMIKAATRYYGFAMGVGVTFLLIAAIGLWQFISVQRQESVRRAVDALQSTIGLGVPPAIRDLDALPRSMVLDALQNRLDDPSDERKLPLAYALARFKQGDPKFLVDAIANARAEEWDNLATALAKSTDLARQEIQKAAAIATDKKNWSLKTRLATMALYLGDPSIAAQMLQIENRPDPIQRTMFIELFPKWCGDLAKLTDFVHKVPDASLCSGICLAVGSVEEPTAEAKAAWKGVLADWFVNQPDAGTHSASGWALRKWGLSLPAIPQPNRSSGGFGWEVTKTGLTILRMPQGRIVSTDDSARPATTGTVTLPEFWLADREVTVALFQHFVDDKEYKGDKPLRWRGPDKTASPTVDHPVQQVHWYEAAMFCNWVSWKEDRQPCYKKTGAKVKDYQGKETEYDRWKLIFEANGYRLPTAAQWEYACRVGSTTVFSFGDNEALLARYCVYNSIHAETVGSRLCNGWGLFDMHGNVWEWCQDLEGSDRVYRGGSWPYSAALCRSANRSWFQSSYRLYDLGFRVALVQSR